MNILLSAYACEPNRGSEPGVGWHWAIELARLGHEVWVMTRKNNQAIIESVLPEMPERDKLHFIYYDLPPWLRCWKRGSKGVQIYYLLWQIGIFLKARELCNRVSFDWVHHVTFVSVRMPSFLGLLGIPFIFGPVAGGERAPLSLRKSYLLKGKLWDGLRDCLNVWVRFDPLMHLTFRSAQRIYVTSQETRALIPAQYQAKTYVQLAIGIEPVEVGIPKEPDLSELGKLKVLYVGNLLYLKGMHLGLEAFARFLEQSPGSTLTLIGSGPEEQWLKNIAQQLNIQHAVEWIPKISRLELMSKYPAYDVFLFPSLHDSGGMVILEAMMNGLPIVCLDLGGPGVIVDETCGRVIPTDRKSEEVIEKELLEALVCLSSDAKLFKAFSEGAKQRASMFQWSYLVKQIYSNIQ